MVIHRSDGHRLSVPVCNVRQKSLDIPEDTPIVQKQGLVDEAPIQNSLNIISRSVSLEGCDEASCSVR